MRQTQIFGGSSHPALVEEICRRLGQKPAKATLGKFSNGETSVQLETSIRDQDVFIVQSGSSKINDNVMELLIMISACKSGSAKTVTAVVPYFPYSRQSKKKTHRGSITARMLANLMDVAGVTHVITIDLHASQIQGFFKCPVDNLISEHLLARWIKARVQNWRRAVVVSKNPGGTKRVTSLADALKLSFGIINTDRRRSNFGNGTISTEGSTYFESTEVSAVDGDGGVKDRDGELKMHASPAEGRQSTLGRHGSRRLARTPTPQASRPMVNGISDTTHPDSLSRSSVRRSNANSPSPSPARLHRAQTVATLTRPPESENEEFADGRARDVVTGRLRQGHIVDDDFPSQSISALSASIVRTATRKGSEDDNIPDHMMTSFVSTASSYRPDHALGGTIDATATSDEEEEELRNPDFESTVTLVGDVKDRPVFIVDDIMDRSASWIAAAETASIKGRATEVYCMATHGLFGGDSLEELEECDCIDHIVVTNSFPILARKAESSRKLVVLDVAPLLAEAMRRNHFGESVSALYQQHDSVG